MMNWCSLRARQVGQAVGRKGTIYQYERWNKVPENATVQPMQPPNGGSKRVLWGA